MKIDSISFTSTYLKPSIRCLSEKNRRKVEKIYPLGEVCQVDLFVGASSSNKLDLDIVRCSSNKYLASNSYLNVPEEYAKYLPTILALEKTHQNIHGSIYPIKKVSIKHLDKIDSSELPYIVADEIVKYEVENAKLFTS